MITIKCILTNNKGSYTYLSKVVPRINESVLIKDNRHKMLDVIHSSNVVTVILRDICE